MKINPPANRHLILLQYVFFISAILYFGRTLFVPLSFAVLISCFLYPVCVWLEKHKLKRMGAVLTSIFALTILFSFLVVLMISQLKGFFNEWPELQSKLLNSVEFNLVSTWRDWYFCRGAILGSKFDFSFGREQPLKDQCLGDDCGDHSRWIDLGIFGYDFVYPFFGDTQTGGRPHTFIKNAGRDFRG